MLRTLIAAALLASSTALFAQAAPAPVDKPEGKSPRHHARYDCSKAKDPKACEEMRAKMRESAKKARAACDAKAGDERRDCMRKELCAASKDPAKCEARAKAQAEKHAEKRKQRSEQHKK